MVQALASGQCDHQLATGVVVLMLNGHSIQQALARLHRAEHQQPPCPMHGHLKSRYPVLSSCKHQRAMLVPELMAAVTPSLLLAWAFSDWLPPMGA